MRKLVSIFIILNLFSFINLNAQNFEPNNSIFEIYDYQFEYYSKIRNKLFKNLSDSPELRLLVKPSFSPEYIFQIEKDKTNEIYIAKLNIVNESIWYSKNYNSIIVNEYTAHIENKDADLLSKIYLKSIEKSHFPIKDFFGLDGVTYNFSVWDKGIKSGTIWSPDDFQNKMIIEITEKLISQIKAKKQNISLTKEDRDMLEEVLKKLNKLPEIENYQLALEIKELIENKKELYNSQLSENHQIQYENILSEFERQILLQLTFNNLELNSIKKLIDKYQKKFENYIEFETYKDDTNNIEDYKKLNIEKNIFVDLKNNVK